MVALFARCQMILMITALQTFYLVLLIVISDGATGDCRHLEFEAPANDVALINHVIATAEVPDLELCRLKCYLEPRCVSLNLGPIQESHGRNCKLCDADDRTHLQDFVAKAGYIYQRLTKNACSSHPCAQNATCQTGFTQKGYRCICPAGFIGEQCQIEQKAVTICEKKRKIIRCSDGGKIQVTFANYGRLDNHTCPHNFHDYQSRTDCRAQTSLARVRDKCQDRNSCKLNPTISLFREDPCLGIFKYLLVKYHCEN